RLSDAVITNYQHNAANRLTENSSYTYTYDANGNLDGQTEKATNAHTTYAYNSENQLISATMSDGTVATYKYDPLGRRIEKAVTVNSVLADIHYRYDNEDIIATVDGNNIVTASFTHGPGIDEPLILKKTDTGANYYYNVDGLGSIIALSDNNGAIVETMEYQVYGKPIFKDASNVVIAKSVIGNIYSYTSREFDYETGLVYLRARYYSAETGRFLQQDPRCFGGVANLYVYVNGNPLIFYDPSGLAKVKVCLDTNQLTMVDDNGKEMFKTGIIHGCPGTPTPTGIFVLSNWEANKKSFKWGKNSSTPWDQSWWGGNVFGPYFVAVIGGDGIGIHGTMGPSTSSLWGWYSSCSHGCIRLSNIDITKLHDLLPNPAGTQVTISNNCGEKK
ncbi:MAG TPA: hypothetical protein DCZ93_03800, partial [Elusimicrobia bacterium]|nr:hypothetical protein [Elusimicrobiota bacterium]